jgi:protein kinase-like protein
MPSWEPMRPGTLLHGRYEIEGVSGRGGFGATYRVRDRERFGQLCAVKELLPAQAENPKVRELFEREARTLLSLRHPGIPAFHAFFFREGRYYLVEDFVAGKTLAQELAERGRFSEAEVVAITDEVLTILEYLHGRTPAVIHRDIKPANIIHAATGGLYLVDFGAVKEAMVVAALSAESTIIGTSGYTPPEQLRGLVVPASDLYAVGATALHLLSGRSPAELYNIVDGAWRFAGQLGVSASLETILARLVEEQLSRRIQSAAIARAALRDGDLVTPATRAMSSSGMLGRAAVVQERPSAPPAAQQSVGLAAASKWRQWLRADIRFRDVRLLINVRWLIVGAAAAVVSIAGVAVALKALGPGADRSVRGEQEPAPVASAPVAPVPVAVPATPMRAPSAPAAPTPRAPDRLARNEQRPAEPMADAGRRSAPPERRALAAEPAPIVASPAPAPNAPSAPVAAPGPASPSVSPQAAVSAVPAPAEQPAPSLPHRTYRASLDRVWPAAERALKTLGWDIDKRDWAAGTLVTESRRLDGDNFGVYAKGLRHRLRLQLKSVGEGQTVVTVERTLFRRERIFWVNSDDAVTSSDSMRNQRTEEDVLATIGRGL